MSPSRLHWPARRSLFRKRTRGGVGAVVLLSVSLAVLGLLVAQVVMA